MAKKRLQERVMDSLKNFAERQKDRLQKREAKKPKVNDYTRMYKKLYG